MYGDVFWTVAPVFLLIVVGALARLLKLADDSWVSVLNKYGLYIGFPALIFAALTKIEGSLFTNSVVYLDNAILLTGILLVSYFVMKLVTRDETLRNTYFICIWIGNVAYIGFPFLGSLVPGSSGEVSIIVAIYLLILFTVGLWFLERSRFKKARVRDLAMHMATSPLLLSVILGLIVVWLNLYVPPVIDQAVNMIAASASPVVLLALGIFIVDRLHWSKDIIHAAVLAGFKLAVLPVLFLFLVRDPISIIEAGMPVAITTFALAEVYPMRKTVVVSAIIISTLISVITLPFIAWLVLP
jgi:predicted permease